MIFIFSPNIIMSQFSQAKWSNLTCSVGNNLFLSHWYDPSQAPTAIWTWVANIWGGQETNRTIPPPTHYISMIHTSLVSSCREEDSLLEMWVGFVLVATMAELLFLNTNKTLLTRINICWCTILDGQVLLLWLLS